MSSLVQLTNSILEAGISSNGKLVSLVRDGIEYLHGGAKPKDLQTEADKKGWPDSEIVMFPVVGPVKDFKVKAGGRKIIQDQHGISRNLCFDREMINLTQPYYPGRISLTQYHDGISKIQNPKHLKDSKNPEYLDWPFEYLLRKTFELEGDKLKATFSLINLSKETMPYMFGWHPAFKVNGNSKDGMFEIVDSDGIKQYRLEELISDVSQAKGPILIADSDYIAYGNKSTGIGFYLDARNFGNFMLWSPGKDAGMFCIEPVTQIPVDPKKQAYFTDGKFESLKPSSRKDYSITITPFNQTSKRR